MSIVDRYDYPNRTYCQCLEEMRVLLGSYKKGNLISDSQEGILLSLIEEIQVYGNRMEAKLEYKRDIQALHEERKKLIEEIRKEEADAKLALTDTAKESADKGVNEDD